MRVALLSVYSHDGCTLKDVAGGYGTVFEVGTSWRAQILERAKGLLADLPPVVLGQLAATIRAAGHVAVPASVRRTRTHFEALPVVDVALVQTSIVDTAAERAVMRELRQRGTRVIAFGAYASERPLDFVDDADVVLRGEPEALGDRLLDPSLHGIVEAGWVEDLDALPFADWSAFDVTRYRYAMLTRRGPTLPLQSARGCAYGCGYCPWRATAKFRERDPERVALEAKHLRDRFGAHGISFRDPLFNLDPDRVRAIARGLAPLGLKWSAEMRADRLDASLLGELYDAGLRSLEIGVESIDRSMLSREHRKPPTLTQIGEVVHEAQRLGIRVICNYLLGLPDDDRATIEQTVAWAKELDSFAVQFTVATPYPGTTLEPLAPKKPTLLSGFRPSFEHPRLSHDELVSLREWAYVSYHYRPRYAARFVRHAARALFD